MYWLFVIGSLIIVIVANFAVEFALSTLFNLLIVLALLLGPSIVAFVVGHLLSEKKFNTEAKFFKQRKNEKKLMGKLKVKNWKDKIPNFGAVGNSTMEGELTAESVKHFIFQTCQGEIIHLLVIAGSIIGFVLTIVFFRNVWLKMALPILFTYLVINTLSILVQRFNRARLFTLLKHLERSVKEA